MKQRFRPTLYTNTSTGDALNDPDRDPAETRRERQSEVKVTSRCIHKVHKEVVDDVRPQLRDGRDEERPSWSRGRYAVLTTMPRAVCHDRAEVVHEYEESQ